MNKTTLQLSHVDQQGKANMVDVSDKPQTIREAVAEGYLSVSAETMAQIQANNLAKGDVFSVARIAGIQAAKNCANLIPLCHPLMLSKIAVDFELEHDNLQVRVICRCKLKGSTGVEMEALTGVSVAALTLFDMCKAIDLTMTIHSIRVLQKHGGKNGNWTRKEA